MGLKITYKTVEHGTVEYALSIALRDRVLRRPLGLYFTPAQLREERNEFHLSAWVGNRLLACLVLKPLDAFTIKMRQVVVEEGYQGSGIGKNMVIWSENFAREHLFQKMVLHARDTAVAFYAHLGYEAVGEPFNEVSIPHQAMQKTL
jgi:predicted GNAT family N-acyltransferase